MNEFPWVFWWNFGKKKNLGSNSVIFSGEISEEIRESVSEPTFDFLEYFL